MSIQNMKALVVAASLTSFGFNTYAQIEKGTSTLGGDLSFDKTKLTSQIGVTKANSLNFSPSFGHFITDKIMVKGRLNSYSTNSDFVSPLSSNQDFKSNSNSKSIGLELEGRYYFDPKANWKFFGGASVGYQASKFHYENNDASWGPNNNIIDMTTKQATAGLFLGVNKFLNSEIAFEATLGYYTTAYKNNISSSGKSNVNHNVMQLNIGLTNFIKLQTKDKNFDGLIDKGRTIIGGNINVSDVPNLPLSNDFKTSLQSAINLEYGKFVAKGLLVGSKANAIIRKGADIYGASAYAQYFYPVTKRLMLHAKAEVGGQYDNLSKNKWLNLNGGVGATYFITKNTAITFDALNFSNASTKNNTGNRVNLFSITPQVGFRFFF